MSKETAEKKTALVLLVAHEAIEKGSRALRSDDIHLLRTSELELTAALFTIGDLLIWLLDTDLYKPNANRDALLTARDEIWRLRPEVCERSRVLLSRPRFDGPLHEDQYPSEVVLEWIEGYDCYEHGVGNLLSMVKRVWWRGDRVRTAPATDGYRLTLITGGWSGNEDVVTALQENWTFWPRFWERSERGGKHEFHIK